jgi:predicted nucleic acid-binding protein
VTAVIADTDILSTFGKIGRLDLLQLLFDQVYIASAVWRELGVLHILDSSGSPVCSALWSCCH